MDPYRTRENKLADHVPELLADEAASFENAALTTVMIMVGGLGNALGTARPECGAELSMGLLRLFFVAGRMSGSKRGCERG